jgi:hypothetical protein
VLRVKGIRLCCVVGHCVVPKATFARHNHLLYPFLCCSYHIIPYHSLFPLFPSTSPPISWWDPIIYSFWLFMLFHSNYFPKIFQFFSFPLFPLYWLLPPFFYVVISYSVSFNIFHLCYAATVLKGKSRAPTLHFPLHDQAPPTADQ